jgi:zinc transport system ATP-binding protein
MKDDCLINVDNICFSYGGGLVLTEASMCVKRGEFVGLIGGNGSGKSTLLKLILGQLKPTCGKVEIAHDVRIGYVEQTTHSSDSAFPATVSEIVTLGLYSQIGACRFPNKTHREAVGKAIAEAGLGGMEKRRILFLSGGEQQKVQIAKVIVSDPDLIILDEPMAGIDTESENSIWELLKKLNGKGKTIVMVTHELEKIDRLGKIYMLKNAKIEEYARV